MTSKKSFFNLIRICLRNNIWSIALTCIGLFFAMPVYGALYVSDIEYKLSFGLYRKEILPALYRRAVLGENNALLIAAVVIIALITAIGGFSYLFSKQKVDLFHSIPRKRGLLFAANYIAGIIGFVVPYIFFMILALIVGKACNVLDGYGILSALITFVISFLGFIGVYSVATLAAMLTGNTLVCILASGVFLIYGPALVEMFRLLQGRFFITYTSYMESEIAINTSVASLYLKLFEGMDNLHGIYNLSPWRFVAYILVIAAIIAISYYLYRIRPSEAAGRAIAFKKSMPVISVLLLSMAAVYGGLAFEAIASGDRKVSYGWLIFGAVIVILIGHCVLQAIYFSDFKSLFKNLENPGIAAVIAMFIFIFFIFDISGFDKYIPKESDIAYMAISSDSLQGSIEYYDFDREMDEYGNYDFWVSRADYRFENMKITDKELIRDFATVGISESKTFDEKNMEQDELSARGEDTNLFEDSHYINAQVLYTLKNGKTKCRSYYIDILSNIDLYNRFYSGTEYKEGVYDILTVDADDYENITVACPIGTLPKKLSKVQMDELVKVYKKDLLKQDAYELRDSVPIGYIYEDRGVLENGYMCNYRLYTGYIYPSFTDTIATLNSYGIDFDEYMSVNNVESITVRNYHPSEMTYADKRAAAVYDDIYVDEDVEEKIYTSAADIAEIYKHIVPMEMHDVNYILRDYGELEVSVEFKEMPGKDKYAITYTFLVGETPDFVKTDVNYSE